MATIGFAFLVVAFVAALASVAFLLVGHLAGKPAASCIGRWAVLASAVALLVCCSVLVACFMTGDVSILYVLEERSLSTDGMAWLYKLSGLWAGRAGSLLFWAFLIALFNAIVLARSAVFGRPLRGDPSTTALRASAQDDIKGSASASSGKRPDSRRFERSGETHPPCHLERSGEAHPPCHPERSGEAHPPCHPERSGEAAESKDLREAVCKNNVALDNLAMMAVSAVVAVFCGLLLFSDGNMPFSPTPERYFDADGSLSAAASLMSMNSLLEHWAMAIHPPMLFVGYAGLTVPFGYAMAALILNDASKAWVERATRFVLASWLFLGAGIGLGAVWAYVVLGWGGYWGWDPVENASLLSWLVCVALVHTFTVYRQRGAFKRWAVMCACLAFTFVIEATFITRSGIVESVHAFSGDPVSLALFGGLIVLSVLVPVVFIIMRWKSFGPDTQGADDIENVLSKDGAYYFNNVIMIVFTLLLTYMTLTSALPSWLPFGSDALGTTAYEAIARPLGIVYLLILAVCPLLAWGKTDHKKFLRQARVPALCALVLFALLAFWWATQLLPVYDAMMAKGNANSQTLLEAGPAWYYNGLALAGLLVASLLFFNAAFMFARNVRVPGKRGSAIGGSFAHVAMAVILIGLVGSNMYVYEESGYMAYDEEAQTAEPFQVSEYRLEFASESVTDNVEANNTALYDVVFDVYKDDAYVGQVNPSIQLDVMTQQQKINAGVISFPEEDLFVVYRGVNANGDFSLDARVNPFILLVWVGFGMLMLGTLCALVMPRRNVRAGGAEGYAQKLRSPRSVPARAGATLPEMDALATGADQQLPALAGVRDGA